MNPKIYTLPFLERNADKLDIEWINTKHISDDWKVKIFEHKPTGLLFAIYDRKVTLIRLEHSVSAIAGVKEWSRIPKSSAFDAFPKFAPGLGYCVKVETRDSLNQLLQQYCSSTKEPPTILDLHEEMFILAEKSSKSGAAARRKRLDSAPKKPSKRTVTITVYDRNPDVVAEVLERADGVCEICSDPAPFVRRVNGTAYLEVHHKVLLSRGGDDTVDNAIAVCPNCHRKVHYG